MAKQDGGRTAIKPINSKYIHPRYDRSIRVGLHYDPLLGWEPPVSPNLHRRSSGTQHSSFTFGFSLEDKLSQLRRQPVTPTLAWP